MLPNPNITKLLFPNFKLIIVEMVFSLSAPIHIPSSMLLKAHANHHLEACEHDIGHSTQEQNPEEPPWEGIIWKMSSIDRSQHPDNLMPKTRRSTKIAIQNQKKKKKN